MAFESLSSKLQSIFSKLTGKGKLSEIDIKNIMREVRIALLEADVSVAVAREFINRLSEKALGQEIMQSLTPGQHVIKLVNQELTELMGSKQSKLTVSSNPPTVIMLCGLQGAGKTTMAAKLAGLLKSQGKHPMLVACDIYRPAAIEQLKVVGSKVNVPVFEKGTQSPIKTAKEALQEAKRLVLDTVIIDTAGRLHIDEELMQELSQLKAAVNPHEILLVVDAMIGQDSVNTAKAFDEKLDISGVIITKLDGDTRGGAALSIKHVTGKPIKFSGIGEKLNDIEAFHPERMASRILGMGDVLTLIEKVEQQIDQDKAIALERKMRNNKFDLEDFLDQFKQIKKMGSMQDILNMLPGGAKVNADDIDEKQLAHTQAIIESMTKRERLYPEILNANRRKRIAAGSGTTVQDINRLIKQFESTKQMMKRFSGKNGMRKGMKFPF